MNHIIVDISSLQFVVICEENIELKLDKAPPPKHPPKLTYSSHMGHTFFSFLSSEVGMNHESHDMQRYESLNMQ